MKRSRLRQELRSSRKQLNFLWVVLALYSCFILWLTANTHGMWANEEMAALVSRKGFADLVRVDGILTSTVATVGFVFILGFSVVALVNFNKTLSRMEPRQSRKSGGRIRISGGMEHGMSGRVGSARAR